MAQELCSRCLRSLDESELAAIGSELLCPRCQAVAATGAAHRLRATSGSTPPTAASPAAVGEPQGLPQRVRADVMEWCRGRWWWARLPLLAFFAYMLVRHLLDQDYHGLFGGINLGIHELGHYVFAVFGEFMNAAGGTILQCLAPLISMVVFWRQRDYFAILLCFGWLATNLFDVATYMADARARELPLVSPGIGAVAPGDDTVGRDWNFMFRKMGLLIYDRKIASCTRVAATASMLLFLLPGSFLVWRMWRTRDENPVERPSGKD